ncbi:MAG: hypothetical protein Q8M18_09475 [Bradyrhizobium sp.]|nr:hypothetical protein [Bradyrhizobium sp.]
MGDIDVGRKTSARTLDQPLIERLARTDGTPKLRIEAPNSVRMKRSVNCGAMSQQCGDSGNYSTPQKLVQLVGCRDPKARSEPWVRPDQAKP